MDLEFEATSRPDPTWIFQSGGVHPDAKESFQLVNCQFQVHLDQAGRFTVTRDHLGGLEPELAGRTWQEGLRWLQQRIQARGGFLAVHLDYEFGALLGQRVHAVGGPVAWFHGFLGKKPIQMSAATTWSPVSIHSGFKEAQFQAAVKEIHARIRIGDVYQVNLATHWTVSPAPAALALFQALCQANPGPYNALVISQSDGLGAIISNTPELLVRCRDGVVDARPIAGTRRRHAQVAVEQERIQELQTDAKEQQEHRMLVDLVRNDLQPLVEPGSLHVAESGAIEHYQNVFHLISHVVGTKRPHDFVDAILATFPGATITGAPKSTVMETIAELEPGPRGPYTGSIGIVEPGGDYTFNILIRTVVTRADTRLYAGSGIVWESNPHQEWKESEGKAQAILGILSQGAVAARSTPPGTITPGSPWHPTSTVSLDAKVWLVDCRDSFTRNLVDALQRAGADVLVQDRPPTLEEEQGYDVVVLGPGPGHPRREDLLRFLEGSTRPVVGICLGFQALLEASGNPVEPTGSPKQGVVEAVAFDDDPGFGTGLVRITRYHSLAAKEAAGIRVTARSTDGCIQAGVWEDRPWAGYQFHPESVGTEAGFDGFVRLLGSVIARAE